MSDPVEHYAAFVRASTSSLFGTAFLLTGNGSEAEELLQDTLVHLYPKWSTVMAATAPLAYVRRSLVNRFLGSRRAAPFTVSFASIPEPEGVDPTGAVLDRAMLAAAIGRLKPRQRAAVVLRYYHDFTDADIADALGCRVATVRSLISRGLAALRRELPTGLTVYEGEPR